MTPKGGLFSKFTISDFKLLDDTCTSLSLPGDGSLSEFRAACVTYLQVGRWKIPDEGGCITPASQAPKLSKAHAGCDVGPTAGGRSWMIVLASESQITLRGTIRFLARSA